MPLNVGKHRFCRGSQHFKQHSGLLKLMLQFVSIVARRAVLDQRTDVLQREVEQKYCAAKMVGGFDRMPGSSFRKRHNVVHGKKPNAICR